MSYRILCIASGTLFFALAGCGPQNSANTSAAVAGDTSNVAEPANAAANADSDAAANLCENFPTSDWKAWVNAMPGPGPHKLIVIGTASPTSGGYKVVLTEGALDKSAPPTQHVNLVVTRDAGTTHVPKPFEIRGEFTNPQPSYAGVSVDCKGKRVALITDVPTTE